MTSSLAMDCTPTRHLKMRYIEPGEACVSAAEISLRYEKASGLLVASSLVGRVASELGLDYVEVESYPEPGQHWTPTQRQYSEIDAPSIVAVLRERGYGTKFVAPMGAGDRGLAVENSLGDATAPLTVGYANLGHSRFDDDIWSIISSEQGRTMTAPWRNGSTRKVECSEWNSTFNGAGFRSHHNGTVMKVVCAPQDRDECVLRLREIVARGYDRRIAEQAAQSKIESLMAAAEEAKHACACGGHAKYRRGPTGPFFGCSNYPLCRATAKACPRTGRPLSRFCEVKQAPRLGNT